MTRRQLPLAIAVLALLVVVAVVGIGIATGRLGPIGSGGASSGSTGGSSAGPGGSPAGPGGSPGSSGLPVPTVVVPTTSPSLPATLVGAGDIATCASQNDDATARLIAAIAGTVFVAGDSVYERGTPAEFARCYRASWGAFRDRTRPVPGDHEYGSRGAAPYFSYFGSAAGQPGEGWYSYEAGAWRVYALNSMCDFVACGPGSPQLTWLTEELRRHPSECVLAYWHHPRFSSGWHGDAPWTAALWNALYDAGADVVIGGHDHNYERFAPLDRDGNLDGTRGIRLFVAGTGGAFLRDFGRIKPGSEVRNARTHGVLQLTLRAGTYDWRFVPVAGEAFTDAGTESCH